MSGDSMRKIMSVAAIERDGLDIHVQTILFEVPNENFNLEYWVRKAAADYCRTEEGRSLYEYNCGYFNWGDFAAAVPNSFCEKYGFRKIEEGVLSDITVDFDELLVEDLKCDEDEETERVGL